jgi:hypothetical protein
MSIVFTRHLTRVCVFASLVLAGTAGTASAQWSRHHASACAPMSTEVQASYYVSSPGVSNTSTTTPLYLSCPSFDTSEQPDSQLNEVRIYVYDGSNTDGVQAKACIVFRDGTGNACSSTVQTGNAFVGYAVLTLDATALAQWDTTDFGYLNVQVPARSGALGFSWVKGIVATQ